MSELKPCPFCGSPAEHYPDGDMEGYQIMCSNDMGKCPMTTWFGWSTAEEAENNWNRRAGDEADNLPSK